MKHDRTMVGAFPVAAYDRMPRQQALLVTCLREWFSDPDGPARVEVILRHRLGEAAAGHCLEALQDVFRLLQGYGRRPLVRHEAGCPCVGTDEATFAHFVMIAATGDREDAMLVASLLVEGPMLLALTDAAGQAGLHVLRADRDPAAQFWPASATRH